VNSQKDFKNIKSGPPLKLENFSSKVKMVEGKFGEATAEEELESLVEKKENFDS
jgi:hypothetical protein